MARSQVDEIFALAERDADAGRWDAARAGYLRTLELAPSHADAMLQLSYVESFAGRYREALEWAMRAQQAGQSLQPDGTLELIRRLRTFNATRALHELASRLLGDPGTPPRVLVEAAGQLSILNDFDIALECAAEAVRKAPADPHGRLVHGQLLLHHGRTGEGTAEIEHVLRRHPGVANGWWMLSRVRKQTKAANHVAPLRALLRAPELRAEDAAIAARALHKELDDLGDHEGAWQALDLMCRARLATVRYDAAETRAMFDALIAGSAADPAAVQAPPERVESRQGPVPVFIVGMHRSGTTLLEHLLDANPQVFGAGELNDFSAAMRYATGLHCKDTLDLRIVRRAETVDFAEVGRRYLDGVAWRLGGERFFTDKQPANFLNVGFICRALPRARILHMVRDPVETCFSNLRELFSGINEFSYDQRELARYFLQYRRLMAHWHDAWPGRILDVSYSALTRDPASTMRAVAGWCCVEYVPGMSDTRSSRRAVSTASSVQVRERVSSREVPKWAPYARHLVPLIETLRAGGVQAGAATGEG